MLESVLKKEFVIYSFTRADDYFNALFERLKPSLLIMEWISNDFNSSKIVSRIKSTNSNSCKIIIIAPTQDVMNLVPEGSYDGYLLKPFHFNELLQAVHQMLITQPNHTNSKPDL